MFFIDKKYLDLHQVLQEKSLVCESLDLLKNFEVTYDDGYKLNGKAKIVNDCLAVNAPSVAVNTTS